MAERKLFMVKSHEIKLDSEYTQWIMDIKSRYHHAQIKAALKVNSEQLLFNWQLGRDLVLRKAEERWGIGIVEQVSLDLQAEFPDVKGFSVRNLWNMKRWYQFYTESADAKERLTHLDSIIDINSPKLQQVVAELPDIQLQQAVAEIPFPASFAYVPWGQHIEIITKCRTIDEALFYVQKTIENSYSRSALINVIEADFYHKSGQAVSNYRERLPLPQADLAQEITKGNYDLGFITLPVRYDEKALETALEQNITRFLLELGTGFAFMGRQKEIVVSGKTRRIDLLFYHARLKCYVVIELKVKPFEPEFVGKLNFYVSAVDEIVKADDDNPTIGLLICKEMDRTEVQWAFRNVQTPLGVATYSNIQVEKMKELLPTADQIQKRIAQAEEEFIASQKNTLKGMTE